MLCKTYFVRSHKSILVSGSCIPYKKTLVLRKMRCTAALHLLLLVALTEAAVPGYESGNHYISRTEMISRLKEIAENEHRPENRQQTYRCGFLNQNEDVVECKDTCKRFTCQGGDLIMTDCDNTLCEWVRWTPCRLTCGDQKTFRWRKCLQMSNSVKCIGNTLETKTCEWCDCSDNEHAKICKPICSKKNKHETAHCQTADCNQNYPLCNANVMLQVYGDNDEWSDTSHNKLHSASVATIVDTMPADENKDVVAVIVEKLLRMYYDN